MRQGANPYLLLSLVILVSLVAGCAPSGRLGTALRKHTMLEEVLAAKDVASRIQQAEQDLPSDIWTAGPESRPGRSNSSQDSREYALAHDLIEQIKPKFKKMSAYELLDSLKTSPYGDIPTNFSGVSYYLYRDGNQAIIKELSIRNRSELETLREFQNDQSEVYTGDDGPPCSVGEIVRNTLLLKSR